MKWQYRDRPWEPPIASKRTMHQGSSKEVHARANETEGKGDGPLDW